jgi:hypothetical protein
MYKSRLTVQVKSGRFKEYLGITDRMSDLSRSRGWTVPTILIPTVGRSNQIVSEFDYPDLATFERELAASFADAEAMAQVKEAVDCLVEGSIHSELLQTISTADMA